MSIMEQKKKKKLGTNEENNNKHKAIYVYKDEVSIRQCQETVFSLLFLLFIFFFLKAHIFIII